jgi:hypothetical protein
VQVMQRRSNEYGPVIIPFQRKPLIFIPLFLIYPIIISGWWLTYPSEKYESQLGWLFPIYGTIKNVPNHQPDILLSFLPKLGHVMNPTMSLGCTAGARPIFLTTFGATKRPGRRTGQYGVAIRFLVAGVNPRFNLTDA